MASSSETSGNPDQVIAGSLSVQPDRRRAETLHRLQIGAAGLFAMVLLIGLANVIMKGAEKTESASVPEAAATIEPTGTPPKNDPLAEAGVVPDMPAQGDRSAVQEDTVVLEQSDGAPAP